MTAIITEKFRLHNATQFSESFNEAAKSTYYMMIGKSTPFTSGTSGGTDSSPPTPADDVTSEFNVWDQAIAAKNVAAGLKNLRMGDVLEIPLEDRLERKIIKDEKKEEK